MYKAGYLGPKGSYSMLAAQKLCPDAERISIPNFHILMQALVTNEVDEIVMPIENSLNGGVMQNIDLLQSTQGVIAVKECSVRIDHRLVTKKGVDKSKITRIYSHPQALGQCARYLAEKFPYAKQIETPSTAGSLAMIKEDTDAGIVGSHCEIGDLEITSECISDEKTNFTQFLLVRRGEVDETVHTNKIYFSVTCKHEPGALMRMLEVFDKHALNMTKIESRPIKDKVGEYRFFIELDADYASTNVKNALKEIKQKANSFKLLGCY